MIHAGDNTVGAPRITAELNDGVPALERVNHKRVARVMALNSIAGYVKKRRVRTTIPAQSDQKVPDLLKRDFTATAPNRRYVGDITYLPIAAKNGHGSNLYLATVIDCYSKKIIGYAMDDNYRTPLISTAIRNAAQNQPLHAAAIFHTDRGSNYTSNEFHDTLRRLDLRHSVGRTGVCWDNAMAESFFAALKNELVHRTVYPTRAHAMRNIAEWIDGRYNSRRLHSGIGYRTPTEAHKSYNNSSSAA